MRLLTYLVDGEPRYGAAVDGGVIDLTRRIGRDFSDVRALIAGNGLADAQEAMRLASHKLPLVTKFVKRASVAH